MKVAILTKICLNETYNSACVGKYTFVVFPTRNHLKNGEDLLLLFFKFPVGYAYRRFEFIRNA